MKRFMQVIIALPIFSAMLCSCNDEVLNDEAVVSIMGLEQSTYVFEAIPDGPISFTVTSNVDWHLVVENLDWIRIDRTRGLGSPSAQTITLEPGVNESEVERSGVLKFVAGSFTKSITLIQEGSSAEPEITYEGLDNKTLYVDSYNIYGATFRLCSNRDWVLDAGGMEYLAKVGPGEGPARAMATVRVEFFEINETDKDINGSIVLMYGGKKDVINVCQKAFVPEISVLENGSAITKKTVKSIGGDLNLVVNSNAAWSAVSSVDWAKLSLEEGEYGKTTISISLERNETGEKRTAELTFTNNGYKTASTKLKITQDNAYIQLSEESIIVGQDGGTLSLNVSSNQIWKTECSESWLSVDPNTAAGNKTVNICVNKTTENAARTATVKFVSASDPELYKIVTINQQALFIDISKEQPLLFNAYNQAMNMEISPTYASDGENGVPEGRTEPCDRKFYSYTYRDNHNVYGEVVNPTGKGVKCIFSGEGNICIKNIWTDDAFVFHIPVLKAEKDKTLCFDFGILATLTAPMYWNAEVSLDDGNSWSSFVTGDSVNLEDVDRVSNAVLPGEEKVEVYYNARYVMSQTVEKKEILVRLICVDGSRFQNGAEGQTKPNSKGTFRLIGADRKFNSKLETIHGPKFYLE